MSKPVEAFPAREIASEVPRETAADRTFSEAEHTAIVADRVAQETASLTATKSALEEEISTLKAEKAQLEAEKAQLEDKLEIAVTATAAVETAFETYKTEQVNKETAATRKGERIEAAKVALPLMEEAFFTAERAENWAAMEDEAFASHLAELAAVAAPAGDGGARDTAMAGQQVQPPASGSASKTFFEIIKKGA